MKLSKNFEDKEFACPCCGRKDISPILIHRLQELRDRVDDPIFITSGVRCTAYNKKINGASNSPHIKGLAADIQVRGVPSYILANIADNVDKEGRLGIYPNHLHLDIVPPNPSRFWLVDKYNGEYIYSKQEKSLTTFLFKNKFDKR